MAATTIFFNGRVISVPGSYTEVDASGLEQVGLGASGIVAMLGEAEGGRPASTISETKDIIRLGKPEAVRTTFRNGDLREAGGMLFEPGRDAAILAGAQEVVAMKVNPAVQGTATLANAAGDAVDLTAEDFGAFTNQINIAVANGTNNGKLITIIFEDITEAFDDVGGTNIFTLDYETGTDTWDTMTAEIAANGQVKCAATRAETGLDGDIVTTLAAPGAIEVVSASGADVGQLVTVYGLDAAGAPVSETLTLNGTTPVPGVQVFAAGDVLGVAIDGTATAGIVTVRPSGGGLSVFDVAAADGQDGLVRGAAMFMANQIVQGVLDAAATPDVIIVGKSASGVTQLHKLVMDGTATSIGTLTSVTAVFTWDGTTTVLSGDTSEVAVNDWIRLDSDGQWFQITSIVTDVSVTIANPDNLTIPTGATARSVTKSVPTFSEVTAIVLGDVAAARTFTLSGNAAQTESTVQTTVTKAADFFNAKSLVIAGPTTIGFVFVIVTSNLTFLMANMDTASATSIVGPAAGFLADLFAFIDAINVNSQFVTALEASGATGGAPINTTSAVFLSGGSEGTTTFQNWQDALTLLKKIRVNTIVAITGDPAIHAAVEAHCAFMGGIGRSERDTVLGALNTALTNVPTKNEFKAQAVNLNSRHVRLVGQAMERFNTSGVREEFLPPFTACLAAGMQAGSPVGTSLTFKFANVLGFRQDLTWSPTDDAEEMIQAGLLLLEEVDGVGRRWVRNVTTHLTTSNIAFTEASVNEAVNFAAFNFRTNMEFAVGQPGFSGTINAAKGIAIVTLGLLVDAGTLVAFKGLDIELVVDVLEIGVQIAPVIPINFVKTTLHLVTVQQAAA